MGYTMAQERAFHVITIGLAGLRKGRSPVASLLMVTSSRDAVSGRSCTNDSGTGRFMKSLARNDQTSGAVSDQRDQLGKGQIEVEIHATAMLRPQGPTPRASGTGSCWYDFRNFRVLVNTRF